MAHREEERKALEGLLASDPYAQKLAGGGGREPPLTTCEDGYIVPLQSKHIELNTYTADSLYGKRLEQPPLIIRDMVPVGLTVFAGAPKRGKSWLALSMALAVSAGKPFLSNATLEGQVLYLDLESRQYRVQARLSQLIQGPAPANLSIAHEADTLDGSLLWQVERWANGCKHPRLVIIDTLGRVRGRGKRGENAYESDTRIFGGLQKFAQERKMAVLCVHHLRKSKEGDDWYERITGSMGLTGVADAVLGLGGKRGEETSTLNISGRDFDERELLLRFEKGSWHLVAEDGEQYREDIAYAGSKFLQGVALMMHTRAEWRGEPSDLLSEVTELLREPVEICRASEASKLLNHYAQRLYDDMGILVNTKRSNGRRKITLSNVRLQQHLKGGLPPLVPAVPVCGDRDG